VHRSTRGWSSGGTGGGSTNGRDHQGDGDARVSARPVGLSDFRRAALTIHDGERKPDILYQTALARTRQLAAHEIGHTLRLGHNYYDSTQRWISVMDHPHPLEKLREHAA
jgi:hypothetical protein